MKDTLEHLNRSLDEQAELITGLRKDRRRDRVVVAVMGVVIAALALVGIKQHNTAQEVAANARQLARAVVASDLALCNQRNDGRQVLRDDTTVVVALFVSGGVPDAPIVDRLLGHINSPTLYPLDCDADAEGGITIPLPDVTREDVIDFVQNN